MHGHTEDKKQGTGSVKFTLNDAAGVATDAVLTADITSKNISKYDYLECWIKSSIDTAAGNLKIQLDDSADCASPAVCSGYLNQIPVISETNSNLDNMHHYQNHKGIEYSDRVHVCVFL